MSTTEGRPSPASREKKSRAGAFIFDRALALGLAQLLRRFPACRRQLAPLLALMLAGAGAEFLTIGASLPFLALIANSGRAPTHPAARALFDALGVGGDNMLPAATLVFAAAALIGGALRLALTRASSRFTAQLSHALSVEIYRRTLYQPYSYHVSRNTSEAIAGVAKAQIVTYGTVQPLLQLVSALVIGVFIFAALLAIDFRVALATTFAFSAIYAGVAYAARNRLRHNGKIAAAAHGLRVQTIQEGLGGIRDVLLDQAQPVYIEKFEAVDLALQDAQAANQFIGAAPRFIVETLGMMLIAGLAVFLSAGAGGVGATLPVLGAFAIAAQRLLPLFQLAYFCWSQIAGNRQAFVDVLAMLDQPIAERHAIAADRMKARFERDICFDKVSFRYAPTLPFVLRDVSLTIKKGARVGLIGRTGGGKSTLMDVLMGLLEPTEGAIRIDGAALGADAIQHWQAQIAHVPQFIYLSDSSVAENIAFAVPTDEIDMDRVREAARRAEIADFAEGLAEGYRTLVGERGVRLSGGQRQRLGIARALYKPASVLVFDEATSALDGETEAAVIRAIESLGPDLTIFIIAHRLSTIAICDLVVKLDEGRVAAQTRRTASSRSPLARLWRA